MTEEEARDWAAARYPAATIARLERFAAMVVDENGRQNLIAPSTIPTIWSRHLVDSLQLLDLAGDGGRWLDIGSGGGFPGVPIAIVGGGPMHLVEPRRRRAEFLRRCCGELGLGDVTVSAAKIEQVEARADIITARAVASIENLLRAAAHCATTGTRWLLPRGSIDAAALPALLHRYELVFHVEQSLTHPDSAILILDQRR